ncbi:phage holin family protein [Methylocystis sp. B8]|uniref:phage holin family protein n=1 Tax=Methylocystis sp. B8 TaxID=544938 RepID=UPI001FEEB4D0|nr:phage holin family protein [Methylocystis sp. B8]
MNMFLDPIFRRVDETIENATRGASRFAIVVILALFALGFATAAAHAYATEIWGEIAGNLVIAGVFIFLAIIVYFATASRRTGPDETRTEAAEFEAQGLSAMALADQFLKSNSDMVKSIGSLAPVAAKAVAERVGPNLHLIIGAALGLMIASKLAEKLDRTGAPEA